MISFVLCSALSLLGGPDPAESYYGCWSTFHVEGYSPWKACDGPESNAKQDAECDVQISGASDVIEFSDFGISGALSGNYSVSFVIDYTAKPEYNPAGTLGYVAGITFAHNEQGGITLDPFTVSHTVEGEWASHTVPTGVVVSASDLDNLKLSFASAVAGDNPFILQVRVRAVVVQVP